MLFSLKFQRNNRQNALAEDSAKGKTGEKGCNFHRAVEMKQPHTMTGPKEYPIKCPIMEPISGENQIKSIYFQCTTKTKQPYAVTEPLGTPKE